MFRFKFRNARLCADYYSLTVLANQKMNKRHLAGWEERVDGVDGTYDVAIIGGGINGCGIARDAAGRGLSVYFASRLTSPAAHLRPLPS